EALCHHRKAWINLRNQICTCHEQVAAGVLKSALNGHAQRAQAGAGDTWRTHVAIAGPSGSGKSSLVSLLLHLWDPDLGRIQLDGHDRREITLDSQRGQMGLLFQDTLIFD